MYSVSLTLSSTTNYWLDLGRTCNSGNKINSNRNNNSNNTSNRQGSSFTAKSWSHKFKLQLEMDFVLDLEIGSDEKNEHFSQICVWTWMLLVRMCSRKHFSMCHWNKYFHLYTSIDNNSTHALVFPLELTKTETHITYKSINKSTQNVTKTYKHTSTPTDMTAQNGFLYYIRFHIESNNM